MTEQCAECGENFEFCLYKAENMQAYTWNENYNWMNPAAGLYPHGPYKHMGYSLNKLIPCCPFCEKPLYQSSEQKASEET